MGDGLEEEEEISALRTEISRLEAELSEERAKPVPEDDGDATSALWDAFPFGDVGQGIQPQCRRRRGPLTAVWRAYFEHTMPGGLKSAALLRFAARTDADLERVYPCASRDWREKLLEVSLVLLPAAYDCVKTETADAKSMNMVHNGLFQYNTKLGYPWYPFRVQEQDVSYLGGAYGPNMTEAAAKRTLQPGEEMFDWRSLSADKPCKVASLKSVYLACSCLGDAGTPHTRLPDERAVDYADSTRLYRDYHLDSALEGPSFPAPSGARSSVLMSLYPAQSPLVKFKPTKMFRSFQFIGGWLGQTLVTSSDGVVSHCVIPDLLPSLQAPQQGNPFESSDLCGLFLQCRGWLRPHAEAEVVLFSDEARRSQLFVLCNAGSEEPAFSGFIKHTPRKGDIFQHEVLLASRGVDFLLAHARGNCTTEASADVLAAIDLSDVKRH